MVTNDGFLRNLIKLQRKLGFTDQKFAEKLNVARSLWTQVRLGDKGIGVNLLSGIATAFPDMDRDILKYLRGRNGK